MNHALSEPVSHVFVKAWVNQHAEKRPNFYHNMHIPKSYPKTSILTNHSHRLNQTAPKNFHFFHNWNFGYCFFWNFYRTWETEGYSNKRIFDSSPHRYISFSSPILHGVYPRSAVDSVHSEEFRMGGTYLLCKDIWNPRTISPTGNTCELSGIMRCRIGLQRCCVGTTYISLTMNWWLVNVDFGQSGFTLLLHCPLRNWSSLMRYMDPMKCCSETWLG